MVPIVLQSRIRWRKSIKTLGTFFVIYVICGWFWMVQHSDPFLFQKRNDCFFCKYYHLSSTNRVPTGDSIPTMALAMDPNSFPYPKVVHNVSRHSAPIVVQLRGEMGNHLSTIAHGIGLQLVALHDYNMSTHLLLRHQTIDKNNEIHDDNPKWVPTSETMQRCFPALRKWQFSLGSQWTDFDRKWKRQQVEYNRERVGNTNDDDWADPLCQQKAAWWQQSTLINGKPMVGRAEDVKEPITEKNIAESLQAFTNLWRMERDMNVLGDRDDNYPESTPFLSVPFLYSDSMDHMVFVKRFLPIFRRIFRIDPACCGNDRPDPDESVFHFRNFAREFHVSPKTTLPSFEEVTPHQTAHVLFANLSQGDKVAITSRFQNDAVVQQHVKALEERGISVRVVTNSASDTHQRDDMHDFCFLLRSQKETVGNFRSTFALWAALLGNAKIARLYTIKSPGLKKRFGPFIKQMFVGTFRWDLIDDDNHVESKKEKILAMDLIPFDEEG